MNRKTPETLENELVALLDIDKGGGYGLNTNEVIDYVLSDPLGMESLARVGGKHEAITRTLHKLANAGRIERIKRGRFYWWQSKGLPV